MLIRRFTASGHRAGMSLILRIGLAGLLILLAASGCRTPWRTTNTEPSFDRLIEIEQRSGQRGPAPGAQAARSRPSPPKYPIAGDDTGVVLPAAAAAVQSLSDQRPPSSSNSQDLEEMLVDVPTAQRELLRREMSALHARNRNNNAPLAESNQRLAQVSTATTAGPAPRGPKASARLSDQDSSQTEPYAANYPDDERPLNEEPFDAKYESELDMADVDVELPAKYRLAARTGGRTPGDAEQVQPAREPYVRNLSDQQQDGTSRRDVASQTVQVRTKPQGRSASGSGEAGQVVTASHSQTISANSRANPTEEMQQSQVSELDWREHLNAALAQLEQQSSTSNPEEQVHQQMVDRLLHLSLGDIEAASEPIEGLQSGGQDFIRHSLKSLYDVTNPTGNPVEIKRYTLAMISQRQALNHLASVSNLEVHNATFCTEVDGFGVVSKFPQYAFKADQELLLYCELDSFVSTQVDGKGYETQLQGSYEIVDANGRRVADQLLPLDSHLCRNQRRDYFIAYRIYMPPKIEPGKYQLKLTVEDLKGRKFGQSNLDFQIQ